MKDYEMNEIIEDDEKKRFTMLEMIKRINIDMCNLNNYLQEKENSENIFNDNLIDKYPFEKSFDEITSNINKWYENLEEKYLKIK